MNNNDCDSNKTEWKMQPIHMFIMKGAKERPGCFDSDFWTGRVKDENGVWPRSDTKEIDYSFMKIIQERKEKVVKAIEELVERGYIETIRQTDYFGQTTCYLIPIRSKIDPMEATCPTCGQELRK